MKKFMKKPLLIACSLAFAAANGAHADQASDLKVKLEALQKQMDQLKEQLEGVTQQMRNQKQEVTEQIAKQKEEQEKQAKNFIQKKPGDDLTFMMGGGEVTLYGYLDVSVDYTTKGIKNKFGNGGSTDLAFGNVGYSPGLSTNLSYLGIRG